MGSPSPEFRPPPQNLVTSILAPALKLWLRSQVSSVDQLEIGIGSQAEAGASLSSRQMLAGHIPEVRVMAQGAIYRGLHLGQLNLQGQNIRMNLGQAVRGKPLRLLAPIAVKLNLSLSPAQLNDSLRSPLLAPLLADWLSLLQHQLCCPGADRLAGPGLAGLDQRQLDHPQLELGQGRLRLLLRWVEPGGDAGKDQVQGNLVLDSGLKLEGGRSLLLHQPRWQQQPPAGFRADLSPLEAAVINLGEEIHLEELSITPEQLRLQGQLMVQP
ncbi:MAG: DUF2993 domain-containing protein [Synechococcales cyanobacterium RM1_1_8]|nr:DUF2993 domain-containing protein [Synechococcales cyanobacterium RM1_1_8]